MPSDGHKMAATGLAVMTAAEVPNFLAGALPSGMTIRRFAAKPEDQKTLWMGLAFGSSLALTVAIGASMNAGTPMPLVFGGIMLAAMGAYYAWHITHPHTDARTIDDAANIHPIGA